MYKGKNIKLTTDSPTFQKAYNEFQTHNKARNLAPATIKNYEVFKRLFAEFIGEDDFLLDSITPNIIKKYIQHLDNKGNSPIAINTKLRHLRAAINYFADCEYMDRIPVRALTSYDLIFAADTNTILLNDTFLSFGVLSKCEITEKTDVDFSAKVSFYYSMESSNDKKISNIENYFWIYAIRYIRENNNISRDSKIALIVDSDLGNLEMINKREKPIADNIYLPSNFQLIYASAERGMEYLPNKIIKYCEKVAKEHLDNIKSGCQ